MKRGFRIMFAAFFAAFFFISGSVGSLAAEVKPAENSPSVVNPVERALYPDTGFKVTYKGIKYVKPDGTFLTNSWLLIGPQAWCFDADGYMATGVRVVNGKEWNLSAEGYAAPMDMYKASLAMQGAGSSPAAPSAPDIKAPSAAMAPVTAPASVSAPAGASAPSGAMAPSGASAPSSSAAPAASAPASTVSSPSAAPAAASTVSSPSASAGKAPAAKTSSTVSGNKG